ncbi:MAG: hypothetical protein ACOH2N_00505 [Devosia sp.]
MARTIIGRLIIQMAQQGAGKTARELRGTFDSIEARARRFSSAAWGAGFQKQLDRLKLSPQELAAVKRSWDRIPTTINGALKRDAVGAWKSGVLSHFADIENRASRLRKSLKETFAGPAATFILGYGAYGVGRNGAVAGAERDRAYLRLDQAGIPKDDQARYAAESERLAGKYPSMSMTEILELALRTQSTMGDSDRTLAILEALVKGQTALMSARNPDAAIDTLDRIVKAGDVLGQNAEGPQGVENMVQLIDGLIRAAQVEGLDFDPGSVLDFARRAKVAGAGWSTAFIAAVGPAIMQDMGGPQSGNALAMAFKSFVLGDNSMNGKVYRGRQAELGLRETPNSELAGADLMTTNPWEWSQKYLLPALERAGVDINDDGAVTREVGKLSGNSNATGQLTRFITQREQYAKSMAAYKRALGIGGADDVIARDPFVAWQGMLNSFSNFSGAIAENAEIVTPGLNSISSAINAFSVSVRENPLQALGLGGLAAGAAGFGAWQVGAGIAGLISAGPSLQTAALMLQGAATSLNGGAAAAALPCGNNNPAAGWFAGVLAWLKGTLVVVAPAVAADLVIGGPNTVEEYDAQVAEQGRTRAQMWDFINGIGGIFGSTEPAPANPLDTTNGIPGLSDMLAPEALTNMGVEAKAAGDAVQGLNGTVSPQVDVESLRAALRLANQLKAALQGIGSLISSSSSNVRSEINGAYADYGVAP